MDDSKIKMDEKDDSNRKMDEKDEKQRKWMNHPRRMTPGSSVFYKIGTGWGGTPTRGPGRSQRDMYQQNLFNKKSFYIYFEHKNTASILNLQKVIFKK